MSIDTAAICPKCNGTARRAPDEGIRPVFAAYCRLPRERRHAAVRQLRRPDRGTGRTRVDPATGAGCLHSYRHQQGGNCYHIYTCTKCGDRYDIDSGD